MAKPQITIADVRRLAVHNQCLGTEITPDLYEVFEKLRCVQIDPINVVARTQHLVLYSRLGVNYSPDDLHDLAYEQKKVFHYWAHAASLVLTEDFPIHRARMRTWPSGGPWAERVNLWLKDNAAARRYILREISKRGPLRARDLEDRTVRPWNSTGWTHGQNLSRMLEFMWTKGEITVAGRSGLDRVWDRSERWFPDWTPRNAWSPKRVTTEGAKHAIRALGAGTPAHVAYHFIRDGYTDLRGSLADLARRKQLVEVEVTNDGTALKGPWYIHPGDLERLPDLEISDRIVPLSPFDNLICDRKRTKLLFDLDFGIEIYVPPAKRRYGYYVLPILDGDRIVALIDPKMDRSTGTLSIERFHTMTRAPRGSLRKIKGCIEDLGTWLGASEVKSPKAEPIA